ncbi:hypothetical protein B7463_g3371, partial [Scytalidium lignicola]
MYSDEDGIATKQSQATYDSRVRMLLLTTSLLSWLGFSAAILNGEYVRENIYFIPPLELSGLLHCSKVLWPLLCIHCTGLHWKNDPIRIYAAGLRGSLLSILVVSSKLLAADLHNEESSPAVSLASLQLCAAVSLAITYVLIPRRPDLFTPDGKLVDLERSSSALGRYSMNWCTAALALAGCHAPLDELPVLDYLTRSKTQPLLVMTSPKVTLWNRILAERYLGFAKQWTLMFVRSIITFGPPYCVMKLLKTLEDNQGRTNDAWIWLIGIGWSEMGIPVRAQLIMAIYQKALRRKDSKDQRKISNSKVASNTPEPINLISSDTMSFSKFTAVNYILPSSFVRFFFAILFLVKLLGWKSSLVGMTVTVLCVPIHTFVIKQQRTSQKNLTLARDKKTKVLTEALHALRQIKFSALEAQWDEYIEIFRQEEIKHLRWSSTASNIKSVWRITAPFLVAAALICTYAYLQGNITPSIIFPMIEVLPHLQETLGFVPVVFQDYFGARSNSHRIDEFLRQPEQRHILGPSPSGHVTFQNASITWPSDEVEDEGDEDERSTSSYRFSLEGINLDFPVGELSIIYGKTGSGKSLLLASVIGEVELLRGRIDAPSITEGYPVAFVSQTPWLQNATVKDNILFGNVFDKERYEKVLAACALQVDLAALAKGDETLIGLRGVKLSGGQRARLAFGRALYSNAQLLVLDDIFSALDSHVSRDIFNALTGELGKSRTRILVTHQVSLCLPKTKYIVHVRNNTISYAGSTDSMGKAIDVMKTEVSIGPKPPPEEESNPEKSEKIPKNRPVVKKAKRSNARTDLKIYGSYFSAAGGLGFTLIYILGLVTKQLLNALTRWLLGRINSTRRKEIIDQSKTPPFIANWGSGLQQYLYLYLWSSLLAITLELLFSLYTFSGSIRASKILFRKMTFKVLRMPILWLDTTPIGEMLKRFTIDTRVIDDLVLATMSEFADCLIQLLTIVGVGLYTSMYTSFLTVVLLAWCAQVSRGYIKARSMVKRADAAPTADILEHFTSSVAGVSTIRAFGAVDRSIEQMHRHLDRLSTAKRHFWIFNRWLGLQMSFIGVLFSFSTGVILLSSESIVDPSLFGFCLTFSMGFSRAIFKAINNFGILETCMDAAGEVIGLTELEIEDQGGNQVSEDWPPHGKVEVKELKLTYSAGLPLVLKGVSFTVEAGQRIGIVGRTGAGKSSLALSLLRLLEPRDGSIHIDGIDISTIKLKSLRSRIVFIPQDPVLFSGTVRSNLDYFKQVEEDKLNEALRRVKLLAEEGDHKSGLFSLDSLISAGGANMSQGQRQLLCLALVLIKNPKIIILDEATSAVDNKTDLIIQDTIRTEFSKTLIVVAHRLRTIASFDQVMVISDGEVAEFGKPAELLRQKGLFYNLIQDSQDKDFLMRTIQAKIS